jgi:hypothetical protein
MGLLGKLPDGLTIGLALVKASGGAIDGGWYIKGSPGPAAGAGGKRCPYSPSPVNSRVFLVTWVTIPSGPNFLIHNTDYNQSTIGTTGKVQLSSTAVH